MLQAPGESGLVVQFGEPARVEAAQSASALVVVGADAQVDGTVREVLAVVGGTAEVTGTVLGDVVVADGALTLGPRARVTGDVTLFGSAITQSPGAVVGGAVQSDPAIEIGRAAALFWWASWTVALVALAWGLVALFGDRPGSVRVAEASRRAGLVGLGVVLVAPVLAGLAFMTGIGVGVGFLLLAIVPGLLVAGFVVAAVAAGTLAMARLWPDVLARSWGPYAAAALGVVALQVLWVIPFVGLLSVYAALHGVGALATSALVTRQRTVADSASAALHLSVS